MANFHGNRKPFIRYNERIRVPQVRLVIDNQNLGVFPTHEALAKARALDLDLVEVAPMARPPVCSILDYGKYVFEKQKKEKENRPQIHREKEIFLRYVTGDHDIEVKANQVRRFAEKGLKVKVVVKFKRRENAHKDKGFEAINKLIQMVEDVVLVELPPRFEGNTIVARLDPKKGMKDESTSDVQST